MDGTVEEIPIIDISPFVNGRNPLTKARVAHEVGKACMQYGFFYISNHGVARELRDSIVRVSRDFFARPLDEKMRISMKKAGRAWRGYFPAGDEVTSAVPDNKEGIYFGEEMEAEHPLVREQTPMCGANLYPDSGCEANEFRSVIEDYMREVESCGQAVLRAISMSMGLEESFIFSHYTENPFILFRIFNYPCRPLPPETLVGRNSHAPWAVGEHCDYGLLTILMQDDTGGLQVQTVDGRWIDAPYVPDTFVCNLGDILELITAGRYRSTLHRVRDVSQFSKRDRLSFPFFLDPGIDRPVRVLEGEAIRERARWDGEELSCWLGKPYGDYLFNKVSKAFPDLATDTQILENPDR
mmetsp:Transcript_8991/g.25172  ORF Transcript_8991/g.25172 Transcript_8991/m.25172 type:complete len:354 (+) Transcript_8991:118-1179(+)